MANIGCEIKAEHWHRLSCKTDDLKGRVSLSYGITVPEEVLVWHLFIGLSTSWCDVSNKSLKSMKSEFISDLMLRYSGFDPNITLKQFQLNLTCQKQLITVQLLVRMFWLYQFSTFPVQYRQMKVRWVHVAKVTLVWSSDQLACQLTYTFTFAPCPLKHYCSDSDVLLF